MTPAGPGASQGESPTDDTTTDTTDTETTAPDPVEPTAEEKFRTIAAEGISEPDREYRKVPARDKPHPSTVMQQEVFPD